jgi:hypothetical protein
MLENGLLSIPAMRHREVAKPRVSKLGYPELPSDRLIVQYREGRLLSRVLCTHSVYYFLFIVAYVY